jgi:hypothetical protein
MSYARRAKSYPRISLGPEYTDLVCFACGNPGACGLIDKHGQAYVACRYCKARCLSLHIRAVASLRYLTGLLRDPTFRKGWSNAINLAEVERWGPPPEREPAPVPEAAPAVSEEAADA